MSLMKRLANSILRALLPRTERGRNARIDRLYENSVAFYIEGKYDDSEREFLKMIQISKEPGAHPRQHARTLKKVGDFYHNNGRYSQAEPLYRRSLELKEKYYPPGHEEILSGLNDMALLHYLQGRYEESEPIYQRLLSLLEEHLGPGNREVAVCLENYAALLRKLKREPESDQLRARARSIRNRLKEE